LEFDEEENEETPLAFKRRQHMKRALHQIPKIITFTIPRQQQTPRIVERPRSPKLTPRAKLHVKQKTDVPSPNGQHVS
jgi:hypothetical protein